MMQTCCACLVSKVITTRAPYRRSKPPNGCIKLELQRSSTRLQPTPQKCPGGHVLAPLAVQISPTEREALCSRLNGALKGVLGAESFVTSQSYYFGGVAGRPLDFYLVEGQPLTALVASRRGPQPKAAKSTTDLSDLLRAPADTQLTPH